jgi:hypothetical protein
MIIRIRGIEEINQSSVAQEGPGWQPRPKDLSNLSPTTLESKVRTVESFTLTRLTLLKDKK